MLCVHENPGKGGTLGDNIDNLLRGGEFRLILHSKWACYISEKRPCQGKSTRYRIAADRPVQYVVDNYDENLLM